MRIPMDELTRSAAIALNRWAARYERLEAERDALRAALKAADVAVNWNDPRIIPTAEVPDQETALRIARSAVRDALIRAAGEGDT